MNGAPVRLHVAAFGGFAGGGVEGEFSNITSRVQNIGFTKDVALHYKRTNSNWAQVPMSWKSNFGDYDVFFASEPKLIEEFVLRHTIGGVIFWDNDEGRNYHFGGHAVVVGGNVSLSKATARQGTEAGGGFVFETSWLEGELYVNNLSPVKEVGIRLSADGGATWEDVNGTFAGPAAGLGAAFDSSTAELWKFKSQELNFNPAASEFRFAVFYRNLPTGEVFWDNNFGQDYKVSKAEGSVAG
jgi:Carbohydrate/starch-binding module (family 21)